MTIGGALHKKEVSFGSIVRLYRIRNLRTRVPISPLPAFGPIFPVRTRGPRLIFRRTRSISDWRSRHHTPTSGGRSRSTCYHRGGRGIDLDSRRRGGRPLRPSSTTFARPGRRSTTTEGNMNVNTIREHPGRAGSCSASRPGKGDSRSRSCS